MTEELVIYDQYRIPEHEENIPRLEFRFFSEGFSVPGIAVDRVNLGSVDMNKEDCERLRDYLNYWLENWPKDKVAQEQGK